MSPKLFSVVTVVNCYRLSLVVALGRQIGAGAFRYTQWHLRSPPRPECLSRPGNNRLEFMNRPARRGTLASIAAELGVSRTTVSNAYNRPDQLSPELREKILRTAQRLGYPGPDPTARSLRTRRAGAIGVLLTEELTYAFEDQASVEFMSGVSVACGKMESSMLLIPAGVDGSAPSAKPTTLVNQASVDGFVVYSVAADDPFLAAVVNRNLPTVVCDQPAKDHQLSFVGIDDHAVIQPVVQQLVEAGHRQVGMLCIRLDREPNNGPVSPERLAGAQMHVQRSRIEGALEVLEKAGVDRASVPIIERHINDATNARSAAEELLTTHPELTAVVCTVDSMALAVAELAAKKGWKIPEQLSVTGFDGIPQAVDRGITTVRQPSKDKGRISGEVLAQLIKGEEPMPRTLLDTAVVEGTSIAAPRGGTC